MDINKKIVKALLEKNYVDAKESVFKALYAKASVLMDEERVRISSDLFAEAKGEAEVEDVEQIDELSKKTLGSYVRKAASDIGRRSADAEMHDEMMGAPGTSRSELAKERKKIGQRKRGIGQAVSRLTKESTEQ